MAEIYKIFAKGITEEMRECNPSRKCFEIDLSEEAAEEMYLWESDGEGDLKEGIYNKRSKVNGYAYGKKWMDIFVKMWREDIASGLFAKFEFYEDGTYPHWWLDEVLKGIFMSHEGEKVRTELMANLV